MNITKCINSVFLLYLFAITIGLDVQAQPQQNRNNTRQVGNMLQRLERSSSRFRNSLNVALIQRSVDQTKPQNDISTFQYSFDLAIEQFRDQFTQRLAVASDVESILQKARPINSFITRNISNPRVTNDWAAVRTNLNTLANAYNISPSWINNPSLQTANRGELIVRDGETLVAILDSNLTTKLSQHGDLFTMTVRDPSQLRGAVIKGMVGNVNGAGRLSGRPELALTFETIRLPNGQSYRFTGILESVRTLNGDALKIDNGVDAVIGASSVFILGKDNLDLPSGTELTIRSSRRR